MICPNCHTEIGEGKKFCGKCGAALRAIPAVSAAVQLNSVSCPACGSKESPGVKFCGVCGNAIDAELLSRPVERLSPIVFISIVAAIALLVSGVAWYVFGKRVGGTYLRYVTPRGRNGLSNLLTTLRSTGGKAQLTKEGMLPSWSPTGELISYSYRGTGGIWMLDVDSGLSRLVIGGNAVWPSFSPDGLRVAHTRTDSEGIWLYDVASEGSRQLAPRGGGQLRWSPDAHFILSGTGPSQPYRGLLITEVGSGRQTQPGIPGAVFGDFDWYSEDLVVMTRPRLNWAAGLPNDAVGIFSLRGEIAGSLKTQDWPFSVAVSPRGQRIAYATGRLGVRVLDSTDGSDRMVWDLGCSPTWSPDERILAADNTSCISYEIPQRGIWAILVEGK